METELNQEENKMMIKTRWTSKEGWSEAWEKTFDLLGLKLRQLGLIYRSMKDKANTLIKHYYGENGWMTFEQIGFEGAEWTTEDEEFIDLFCMIGITYTDGF